MRTIQTTSSHLSGTFVAMAAALLAACGAGTEAPSEMVVRSHGAHFTADNRRFDSLDALETWVNSTGAAALRIEGCAQGSRDSMLAAAARFQRLYLDLRPADEANCTTAANEASSAMGESAATESVEQYWQRVAP